MKALHVFLAFLIFVSAGNVVQAVTPLPQGDGQEYVIQSGDWLSKLADKFYGDPQAWQVILDATNAKAAADSSFAMISDPNRIEVGQKLWIPAVVEATTSAAEIIPNAATTDFDPEQAYLNAVKDAQIAEPQEISKDLIPIVETNSNLVWDGAPGEKRVLALTWTSWTGYDDQVGESMVTSRETWVTIVPQLKNFCHNYVPRQTSLTLRLEELLGLPPNNGKTRFVEMWVKPQDLFRPSPDPEITDQEAGLDFPSSTFLSVSPDYVKWFNDLSTASYGDNGYPWTRLGYTYDWGNPKSEVGLSEFVINKGATIEIHSLAQTDAYCQ